MTNRAIFFLLLCAATTMSLPAQTFNTLYDFGIPPGPNIPTSGLIQATNGLFYGTATQGGYGNSDGFYFGVVYTVNSTGVVRTLYRFCKQIVHCPDGSTPAAALLQATDGNFYGVTQFGGVHEQSAGTIFNRTPSGKLTTLYRFCSKTDGQICLDGANPTASLHRAC